MLPCLDPFYLSTPQWTLGLVHLLAPVNSAAVNVAMQGSVGVTAFSPLKWNGWITWMFCFNFLRDLRAIFRSSCAVLHSGQHCLWVPAFPRPHQHLTVFCSAIIFE